MWVQCAVKRRDVWRLHNNERSTYLECAFFSERGHFAFSKVEAHDGAIMRAAVKSETLSGPDRKYQVSPRSRDHQATDQG